MIQDDIREHLKVYKPSAVFSYGRSFDTALKAYENEVIDWFIFLDPVTFTGQANNTESSNVVIGFMKQDRPDSAFAKDDNLELDLSIEEIQSEAHTLALGWLNDFLDTYRKYSDGSYTLEPITRIKNVMSGKLLRVTLNGKPSC
jgi:hypothetical protein